MQKHNCLFSFTKVCTLVCRSSNFLLSNPPEKQQFHHTDSPISHYNVIISNQQSCCALSYTCKTFRALLWCDPTDRRHERWRGEDLSSVCLLLEPQRGAGAEGRFNDVRSTCCFHLSDLMPNHNEPVAYLYQNPQQSISNWCSCSDLERQYWHDTNEKLDRAIMAQSL